MGDVGMMDVSGWHRLFEASICSLCRADLPFEGDVEGVSYASQRHPSII
jgi:hypothetical protein